MFGFKPREKKEFNLEKWLLKIQSKITWFISFLFVSLIAFSMFGDSDRANSLIVTFLPIITGWLGIIIGFYFSREISNFLEKRLESFLNEQKKNVENYEEKIDKIEEERGEEREDFKKIINSRNALISRLRKTVEGYFDEDGRP